MDIMIVTNSGYLGAAYVLLYSLFENHMDRDMDIYLPYEDITEQELQELDGFVSSYSGKKLFPLYVGDEFKNKVSSRSGINIETYYRIVGAKLLPETVNRILYLDVDMVIKGRLDPLYDMDITGHPFVVCEDIYGKINNFHEINKERLGIPFEYTYFNAGVMLYNMEYLRNTNEIDRILENVYENYERYVYNDQDVMNELYYRELLYVGWDEYNCPPAWYYLDKESLKRNQLVFATYELLQDKQSEEQLIANYQNVTRQILDNARIVHYLGDTKPWSKTRKATKLYDMFDEIYYSYKNEFEEKWGNIRHGK